MKQQIAWGRKPWYRCKARAEISPKESLQHTGTINQLCLGSTSRCHTHRQGSVVQYNLQVIIQGNACQSYPGYFREPHWISMGLPEISGVTWQLCKKETRWHKHARELYTHRNIWRKYVMVRTGISNQILLAETKYHIWHPALEQQIIWIIHGVIAYCGLVMPYGATEFGQHWYICDSLLSDAPKLLPEPGCISDIHPRWKKNDQDIYLWSEIEND